MDVKQLSGGSLQGCQGPVALEVRCACKVDQPTLVNCRVHTGKATGQTLAEGSTGRLQDGSEVFMLSGEEDPNGEAHLSPE